MMIMSANSYKVPECVSCAKVCGHLLSPKPALEREQNIKPWALPHTQSLSKEQLRVKTILKALDI